MSGRPGCGRFLSVVLELVARDIAHVGAWTRSTQGLASRIAETRRGLTPMTADREASVDLYWLSLGAGGQS